VFAGVSKGAAVHLSDSLFPREWQEKESTLYAKRLECTENPPIDPDVTGGSVESREFTVET